MIMETGVEMHFLLLGGVAFLGIREEPRTWWFAEHCVLLLQLLLAAG
jgi:hypothetical protein